MSVSIVICPHGKVEVECSICDRAARVKLRDAIALAVMEERSRAARWAEEAIALYSHDFEDLESPDGSCSDHMVTNLGLCIFDSRCSYCRAMEKIKKIRSGE